MRSDVPLFAGNGQAAVAAAFPAGWPIICGSPRSFEAKLRRKEGPTNFDN